MGNVNKLTREEIDRAIRTTPGKERVLAAVAIGEAPTPDDEASKARHAEAAKIAKAYQGLVGKGRLVMMLTLVRLSMMADDFFTKYPDGDPESAEQK